MNVNFLSTYSDKKSCHTSTTLQTSIAQFVSDSWASCIRFCPDTCAHATVANNVTVWWAEVIVWVARSCMTLVRRYLFAVLSAVLRSGFRDTLYAQLVQTKNKQCKSAIILQSYHLHLCDFCSWRQLTQPYNHIIYPDVAKIAKP